MSYNNKSEYGFHLKLSDKGGLNLNFERVPLEVINRLRLDSYEYHSALEKWCIEHGCLLQANNGDNEGGCVSCNLDDYGLDWCPFHNDS